MSLYFEAFKIVLKDIQERNHFRPFGAIAFLFYIYNAMVNGVMCLLFEVV